MILGGDFNAPQRETGDHEIVPHSGPDNTDHPLYGAPHHVGGGGTYREFTFGERWAPPARKRLDHVLVSDHFAVEGCEIWNGRGEAIDGMRGGGSYKSDHAPVVADVALTG